jgi:hypothetical protein
MALKGSVVRIRSLFMVESWKTNPSLVDQTCRIAENGEVQNAERETGAMKSIREERRST